ncbi:hypothetical protein C478_17941 [Natrinema thermotolerans DSM 11552]|nr:hypothetical protein C478_17941 [Natrinema thermotolerans DSM 11552]
MNLRDNNDTEHVIEMEFDGEIKYHQCETYDDKAANRTPTENEYNEQARKYARYCVYLERGYDTLPRAEHPGRINAVRLAIQDLSDPEFEELFGDFYRQIRSYHDYDTDRPISEPPLASDHVLYRQNLYLGLDPLETDVVAGAQEMADAYGLDLANDSVTEQAVDTLSSADLDEWRAFADDLASLAADENVTLADGTYVDAVSSLYATYLDDSGEQHTSDPEYDPFERDPDTVLELPPIDPRSIEDFRDYLDHHLKCQVRDCFVRMGVEPPEEFRVLGNGRLEAVAAYKLLEMYPDYHDSDTETPLP